MDKKSNLGSFSGMPPFVSEEADREQWKLAPKILGPSIAERILEWAKQAEKLSENNPQD